MTIYASDAQVLGAVTAAFEESAKAAEHLEKILNIRFWSGVGSAELEALMDARAAIREYRDALEAADAALEAVRDTYWDSIYARPELAPGERR